MKLRQMQSLVGFLTVGPKGGDPKSLGLLLEVVFKKGFGILRVSYVSFSSGFRKIPEAAVESWSWRGDQNGLLRVLTLSICFLLSSE